MYGPNVAIIIHIWVSRYETHRFLQVDGGQRYTSGFGASRILDLENIWKFKIMILRICSQYNSFPNVFSCY